MQFHRQINAGFFETARGLHEWFMSSQKFNVLMLRYLGVIEEELKMLIHHVHVYSIFEFIY